MHLRTHRKVTHTQKTQDYMRVHLLFDDGLCPTMAHMLLSNPVSFVALSIDAVEGGPYSCERAVTVVRSEVLVPAPVVVSDQGVAPVDVHRPLADLALRALTAVVPLAVVHPVGLDAAYSADTRCLPLGLCNCVGPVCRYIFPESTASSQGVAVSPSLPLLWEGGHEPDDCSSGLV